MTDKSKLIAPTERPLSCAKDKCGDGPEQFSWNGYDVYWRCPHQEIYRSSTQTSAYGNSTPTTYWRRLKGMAKRKGDRFLRLAEENGELNFYDNVRHYGAAVGGLGAAISIFDFSLWGQPRFGPFLIISGVMIWSRYSRKLEVTRTRIDARQDHLVYQKLADQRIEKLTKETLHLLKYRDSNEQVQDFVRAERVRLNSIPENPDWDEKTAIRTILVTVESMLKPTSNIRTSPGVKAPFKLEVR